MANKHNFYRTAVHRRLRYLNAFLFAGNFSEFEKRLKWQRRGLEHILAGRATAPPELLSRVVLELNVSAAWLLTGLLPVLNSAAFDFYTNPVGPHAVFDPTLVTPDSVSFKLPVCTMTRRTCGVVARAVYAAAAARSPIVVLYDRAACRPAVQPALLTMLRRGWATALIAPSAVLSQTISGPEFATIVTQAAQTGFGLGYAAGRWSGVKETPHSIAYEQNIPFAVQVTFGDPAHFVAPAGLAHYGAALGKTAYLDMLLLAEQVRLLLTHPHSLCINFSKTAALVTAVQNATAIASSVTAARFGEIINVSARLLPRVVENCDHVFKGRVDARK